MCRANADRTDEALAEWEQGDVAQPPAGQPALGLGCEDVERFAVLTQTCDIRRSAEERPFLSLAPIVPLAENIASLAARGRYPRYSPLRYEGDTVFADLDRIVTACKKDLVKWTRTPGVASDGERRQFATSCGRKFARAALPDDLARALNRFRLRVLKKNGKSSREGAALDLLEEIRVTGTPDWDADEVDVFLLFCPPTEQELEAFGAAELEQFLSTWLGLCAPSGVIRSVSGSVIPLDQLSAREYVDSDPLDFGHLSAEEIGD